MHILLTSGSGFVGNVFLYILSEVMTEIQVLGKQAG